MSTLDSSFYTQGVSSSSTQSRVRKVSSLRLQREQQAAGWGPRRSALRRLSQARLADAAYARDPRIAAENSQSRPK